MSKVVKGIGRAVGKVVDGVKKVASSKLGKVLITAAAVYFGGAALMGGIGGATSGAGFLSGASAGLSSAASGISGAWGALTGTGGLSGAASSIGSGFTGAYGAGAATGGSALASAGGSALANTAANTAADAAFTGATETGLMTLPGDAANVLGKAGGKGLVGGMMSSPYAAPALISGGTQLIGGVMQGYGAKKQQDQQVQMAEDERKRYNTNVGTRLWG